jgi:hypothetical protein
MMLKNLLVVTKITFWSPDSKESIIYVCKKEIRTEYAISIATYFEYNLETKNKENNEDEYLGYDTNPVNRSSSLQMKRDGYEADQNDNCWF